MTIEEIRELVNLVTEKQIAEIELQRGDNRVWIKRTESAPAAVPASPNPAAEKTAAAAESKKAAPPEGQTLVRSPIVGTFYESPSPGSPPFVRIGETVQPGKVLCIIESMKLMNEIEAEIAGVIESKLVANGQPVEYGEALFAIRPI
ncbi:MAG: acetyl-CoA carboxylase biotin carboxyl carrier protein [Bryobacteraceae bacterium]